MFKKISYLFLSLFMTNSIVAQNTIYDFTFNSIDGVEHSFSEFKGKKMLLVNTASECGYTPQYEALQALHNKYQDKIVIIGFPANNFGAQEPGENAAIATFCKQNYGVTFLMAEKISVSGSDIHPLFKWLCEQENSEFTGAINWNFEKFLISTDGKLAARHRSGIKPDSKLITDFVEN